MHLPESDENIADREDSEEGREQQFSDGRLAVLVGREQPSGVQGWGLSRVLGEHGGKMRA